MMLTKGSTLPKPLREYKAKFAFGAS
jgi:hypothetical protein